MDGTSLQARLYRSRMNEARGGTHGKISAAQKKKIQAAQKKINAVVAKALDDHMEAEGDEAEESHVLKGTLSKIGGLISAIHQSQTSAAQRKSEREYVKKNTARNRKLAGK